MNFEEKEITIQIDELSLKLSAFQADKIKDTNHYILESGPFHDLDEAKRIGLIVKKSLLLSTSRLREGIDLGSDKATGGLSNYVIDRYFASSGIKIVNDVHGLYVYEKTQPISFAYAGPVNLGIGHNNNFIDIFSECIKKDSSLTDSEILSFELFSASFFEPNLRPRFLTLIMAIESLLKPSIRTGNTKILIEKIINDVKTSDLQPSEKESIKGSLQWLLQESISKTGRDLVNRHLGDSEYFGKLPKQFFTYCYSVRSEMVHTGSSQQSKDNFAQLVGELQRFVADLLTAISNSRLKQSDK